MPKHVPERSCVACRRVRPKRELVRVVRAPDGTLSVDPKGKAPGRGAYLGPARECLRLALERRALQRALGVELSAADTEMLEAELYKRRASCPWREEADMSSEA
ncbi:MAG: YlxR family protein [Fimbriimonadaceae bacterium]|nr:YlxR family protein [Fimbriimonadaceae bacterium]